MKKKNTFALLDISDEVKTSTQFVVNSFLLDILTLRGLH